MDARKLVLAYAALILTSLIAPCSLIGCRAENRTAQGSGPTLYVSSSGNCGRRHPCYARIQDALDAAAAKGYLIKVAQGVYTATGSQVVLIDKSVRLVGGYQVKDWTLSRPESQPAIVDAQLVPGRRGMLIDGSDVPTITVKGFRIQGGLARESGGGGVHVAGGAAVLEDNVIEGCRSDAVGGGVFVQDGSVTLRRNVIRDNAAEYGGGLCVGGGRVVIERNTFSGNTSPPLGGAIAIEGGVVTGANNLVVENAAAGAGVYLSGGHLTASHWTLADNGRYGIIADLGIDIESGSAVLSKSIIASHQGGLCGAGAVARQTLFHEVDDPCIAGASCVNSLFGDPRFIDPSVGNYHIAADSAAVDQAYTVDVTRDMDGDLRPVGTAADIGADEIEPERCFLPLIVR